MVVTTEWSRKSLTAVDRNTEATPNDANTITIHTNFPFRVLTYVNAAGT